MNIPTKEQKEQRTIQRMTHDVWETVGSFQDLNPGDIFRLFEYDGTEIQMHRGSGKSCPGRFRVQGHSFKYENPKIERVKDRLTEAKWAVNAKPVWRFKTKRDMKKRKMKDGGVCGNDFSKRDTEVFGENGWESKPLMHIKAGDRIRYLEEGEYFEHVAAGDAFYDDNLFPACWAITVEDEAT